jgi:hypothetical protein
MKIFPFLSQQIVESATENVQNLARSQKKKRLLWLAAFTTTLAYLGSFNTN